MMRATRLDPAEPDCIISSTTFFSRVGEEGRPSTWLKEGMLSSLLTIVIFRLCAESRILYNRHVCHWLFQGDWKLPGFDPLPVLMLEQQQQHRKPGTKLPSSVLTILSMPALDDCEADSGLVHQQDGLLQRDLAGCRQARPSKLEFQLGLTVLG